MDDFPTSHISLAESIKGRCANGGIHNATRIIESAQYTPPYSTMNLGMAWMVQSIVEFPFSWFESFVGAVAFANPEF